MTDMPQGPGWSQSNDGTSAKAPVPVPELAERPTWKGESDLRPEVGPMYPDLFQQAVSGSSLANVVTVKYSDGEPRPSLDVPMPTGTAGGHPHPEELVAASARIPAEVGAFSGASARKRWRILR